jgi:hypothetical protein
VARQDGCYVGAPQGTAPPCPELSAAGEAAPAVLSMTLPYGFYVLMANVELTNLANDFLQDNTRSVGCYLANDVSGAVVWPVIPSGSLNLPAPGGRRSRQNLSFAVPARLISNTSISLRCSSTAVGMSSEDVQVFASYGSITALKVDSVYLQ